MNEKVNIVCIKWGTLYGPEYVNRLYNGVKRNLTKPFRFICFTDNCAGVIDEVECHEFTDFPVSKELEWSAWRKLCLLRNDFPYSGQTLFLDLDVLITGSIDCFFEFGELDHFAIIHNWIAPRKTIFRKAPDIGNSSCFRFPAQKFQAIYDNYLTEYQHAFDSFPTEQAYLTHCMKDRKIWWPDDWVRSFKRHCRWAFPLNLLLPAKFPKDARIIAFHGRPNPDQARDGFHDKKPHHFIKATKWIDQYWK